MSTSNWEWLQAELEDCDIESYMYWWESTITEAPDWNGDEFQYEKAKKNKIYQLKKGNYDLSFKMWYTMRPSIHQTVKQSEYWEDRCKKLESDYSALERDYMIECKYNDELDNKAKPVMVDAGTDCPDAFRDLEKITTIYQ